MRKILTGIFSLSLLCCFAQKGTEFNGTWVLDSVIVKDGEIRMISYDKLEISGALLSRTLELGKENWKSSSNAYRIDRSKEVSCKDIYKYTIELENDIVKLKKGRLIKCCSGKCLMKLKVLGKIKMLNDAIQIESEKYVSYYHLERTC